MWLTPRMRIWDTFCVAQTGVELVSGQAKKLTLMGVEFVSDKQAKFITAVVCVLLLLLERQVVGEGAPLDSRQNERLGLELLNLPANTWVHVKTERSPVGRSYSGVCYGGGYIFYFGGGHGSHPCNDVELYQVDTNTWIQATEPENFQEADKWTHLTEEERQAVKRIIGGGSGANVLSPKGRPLVRHTYQMHCYFPEQEAFFNMLNGLWAFDPAKPGWKLVSKKTFKRGDVHTQNLTYDPELETIFTIVCAFADRGVHVFDPQTKTWSRKCGIPTTKWSEVYSTYDSARKLHIVRAGGRWWTLNMSTGETKFIKDLDEARKEAGGESGAYTESLSLEYDPESNRTLAIIAGGKRGSPLELWAYDTDKDSWSRVKMHEKAPAGIPNWDLLVYDPVHRCFLFVNVLNVGGGGRGGKTDGLFAFRYNKGRSNKSF